MKIAFHHLRHPFADSSTGASLPRAQQVACQALLVLGAASALYLMARAKVAFGASAAALSGATFYTAAALFKRALPQSTLSSPLPSPRETAASPKQEGPSGGVQAPQSARQEAPSRLDKAAQDLAWIAEQFLIREGQEQIAKAYESAPQREEALECLERITPETRKYLSVKQLLQLLGSKTPAEVLQTFAQKQGWSAPRIELIQK